MILTLLLSAATLYGAHATATQQTKVAYAMPDPDVGLNMVRA